MRIPPFDPLQALRTMNEYGVEFVVIGGIAGRLWGSPTVTNDLDICYRRTPDNLVCLADALNSIHARLRGVDDQVSFRLEPVTLANGDSFTFVTDSGNLDVLGTPSGTTGYDDLIRTADEVDLDDLTVNVCGLEDLIRMKRAAARPKDLIEVEVLAAVRDEAEQTSDPDTDKRSP
jgi:predicted nucleotidyltransferase